MRSLENFYYESLPYAYAALSIFAFTKRDISNVAIIAALMLAYCSYTVFQKRYHYRHKYEGRKH